MKISFIIITYNAEAVLDRSLKSIPLAGNEIIVVDSGSTDRTVAIARKRGAKVYTRAFHDDYAAQKNYAVTKAAGEWVFSLDADEVISDELNAHLKKLVADLAVDAYWFRRKTFVTPTRYLRYGLFYPDYQLRLFRNRKEYRFVGAIHESVTIPYEKTREVPLDLLHFQQRSKYVSFRNFTYLWPYIDIHAVELGNSDVSSGMLILTGILKFFSMFFTGFIRGKGFLDGWAGFRAHLMFAASVALAYIKAGFMPKEKKS